MVFSTKYYIKIFQPVKKKLAGKSFLIAVLLIGAKEIATYCASKS